MNQSGRLTTPGPVGRPSTSSCRGDVVLKGVHQLVAEDVIRFREAAGEREDHAALEHLGDAAGAFADVTARSRWSAGSADARRRG